ncbi:leucine-rich repeat-containing protein 52-like [Sceloporus undulatus]|uniref:leucine-rich repeat-containing protein 52-like n=1 Tax=Sceloporus undulatus TaxID=8520 RepID=UPI001C4B9901|nr:leucine-rich repeat-containing protein 52-like [Sceloporus undulatus]
MGFGCRTGCICEKWKYNCTNAGLRDVPSELPPITRELILIKNHIRILPPLEMTCLNELVYLDCSHNEIFINREYKFPWMEKLTYLDLSFNKIMYVSTWTFSRLTVLLFLNISHNPYLTTVVEQSFTFNHLLRYVDISACNVSYLSPNLFRDQHNLHTLGLIGNPFQCDCELLEFINWLLKPKVNWQILDPDATTCHGPEEELKGAPLLRTEQFLHAKCLPHYESKDHIMNAVLTCAFFAGGAIAAWLLGVISVLYYHPIYKTEDDSDEQEYRRI